MKNVIFGFKKIVYGIIIIFLQLNISATESLAQKWIIHTIPQLPGISVTDMLLDHYGTIWIATGEGVGRFNGEWISYCENNGLVNNDVRCLAQDEEGNIWFGTFGGVGKIDPTADLNDPANWKRYTISNTNSGLVSNSILSITFDNRGFIWIGTYDSGICVADPSPDSSDTYYDPLTKRENWIRYTTEDGLFSNMIRAMEVDSLGNIWAISSWQGVINIFHIDSDSFLSPFTFQDSTGIERDVITLAIFKDKDVNIWLGTERSGIYKAEPGNILSSSEYYDITNTHKGLAENKIEAMAQDKEGAIWFGHATKGVSMIMPNKNLEDSNSWQNFTRTEGFSSNNISAILEDTEENIWFAHKQMRGISQFDRTWLTFLTNEESQTNLVDGLFMDNQRNLWIATNGGAIKVNLDENLLLKESNWSKLFTKSNGLKKSNKVATIFQDSDSHYWFGTNNGISRVAYNEIDDPTKWQYLGEVNGLINREVRSITEDNFRYIWIGTYNGVSRVHIDSTENFNSWLPITTSDSLVSNNVNFILKDSQGKLWFGTDNGISFFTPDSNPKKTDNWIKYNTKDKLIDLRIQSIFEDMSGNIWFASEGGVTTINPATNLDNSENWKSYTKSDGLTGDYVTSIAELKKDELWFGTAVGASKFNMNQTINRWTTFTIKSGLGSNFNSSITVDTLKKDIWFGTRGGGITRYRPKKFPPETYLKNKFDIVAENRIKFGFYGTDLVTPSAELLYQYKIDDLNWQTTFDTSAIIFLEDSPKPEQHIFQVRAIDGDGNIDSTPAKDVFYKINSQMGGHAGLTTTEQFDSTQRIFLLVPPNILSGNTSITIKQLRKYELLDSSYVILAYDIMAHPSEFNMNKPATLTISFLNTKNFQKNQLAIFYQVDDSIKWQYVGGTVTIESDTVEIKTAITEFGIYAVRNLRILADKNPIQLTVQPRVFSPNSGGFGHGDHVTISFILNHNSRGTVKIYNISGRLKKILGENLDLFPGVNAIDWDGRDNEGHVCPTGLYIVTVETDNEVQTRTVMISNKY